MREGTDSEAVPERAEDTDEEARTRIFSEHRSLLVGVAYRLLGSVADAEDVVQEAWLRWARVDVADVRDARAYLIRTTTRLAIDRLRRLKARRESYVGPWLPEPLRTGDDVLERVELAESVSLALLLVLETLSPLERAVFVLHEAFGFPFAEVAAILGRNEDAVRQLAHRARAHVAKGRPRFEADHETRREVTERFVDASASGDLDGLMAVLAPGVTLVADGGGRVRAPLRPIIGADKVARFFLAVAQQPPPDVSVEVVTLNGAPASVVSSAGSPVAAILLDVVERRAATVYLIANPEKLGRLRALAGT